MLIIRNYPEIETKYIKKQKVLIYLRVVGTMFNELIVLLQICFSRLRDDGALLLVIDFSAALIIS